MARLWSTGFELGTATTNVEFVAGSAPTISSTTKRSGSYALEIPSLSSGSWKGIADYFSATNNATGPFYFRFYLDVHTAPNVNNAIFSLSNSAFANMPIWVRLNTDRTLTLVDTVGDIGSTSALTVDTWYRIEVMFDHTGGAGADKVTLRVDGSSIVTATTRTFAYGAARMLLGGNLKSETCTTGDWFFDDVAINDTSGSYQNSWLGSGQIVHLQPDSAGDNAGWAAGAGGTANWNRVSEVTPDDATTYNKRTTAGTFIDDHNCISSSTAGIAAGSAITLVAVGCRVKDSQYGTANTGGILRIKSASGGTVQSSASFSWSSGGVVEGTWQTNGPDMYASYSVSVPDDYHLTAYVDPTTGVAWTPTGTNSLDNMQIGYTNNESATQEIDITTIWALVEYTYTAPATPSVSDTTTITDSLTILIPTLSLNVSDTAAVTDSDVIFKYQQFTFAIFDTATITDSSSQYENRYNLIASDTATVTDSVIPEEIDKELSSSDIATITDSVILNIKESINVSDILAVSDSNFIWWVKSFPSTKFYGQDY